MISGTFLAVVIVIRLVFVDVDAYPFFPSRMHDMRYHIQRLIGLIHQSGKWPDCNISVITDASSIQAYNTIRR